VLARGVMLAVSVSLVLRQAPDWLTAGSTTAAGFSGPETCSRGPFERRRLDIRWRRGELQRVCISSSVVARDDAG